VEGIDADPLGVKAARAKGLNVQLGDVSAIGYADNCFDAITLSHVIEHVHDPVGLLRECARLLKPGGVVAILTPKSRSLGPAIYGSSWLHLDPPRHLHIFNPVLLSALVNKAGLFNLVEMTSIRDANNLFLASRSIRASGTHVMGAPSGVLLRIWARTMQLIEWLLLKVMPRSGEEILLLARK
jgi:ubiquinone/menaquinone biosynthesis C-methylase UbiE